METNNLELFFEVSFNVKETLILLKREGFRFLSWGCDKVMAVKNVYNYAPEIYAYGLMLHVNGHHHKGYVLITLSGNDTYTFRLLNKNLEQVGETETDIYFDELFNRIDKRIEYIPAYQR